MTQTVQKKFTTSPAPGRWSSPAAGAKAPALALLMGSPMVSLRADHNGDRSAIIDGEHQATIDRAVGSLHPGKQAGRRLEVVGEGPTEPAPVPLAPVIGKARAQALHRIMGAAGLPHAQHYSLAAAALGEPWPLETLSDLTEQEAGVVWTHLCRVSPSAREIGERFRTRTAAPAHTQAA